MDIQGEQHRCPLWIRIEQLTTHSNLHAETPPVIRSSARDSQRHPRHVAESGRECTLQLQAPQQLRLLLSELLIGQYALGPQVPEAFNGGEDIRLGSDTRAGGRGSGCHRSGLGLRLCRRLSIDGDHRQAGKIHGAVLTGKQDRPTHSLLLGEAANLMIERIIDPAWPLVFTASRRLLAK